MTCICNAGALKRRRKKVIYRCSHLILVMSPFQMDLETTPDTIALDFTNVLIQVICADLWGGCAVVNVPIQSEFNYHFLLHGCHV